MKPLTIPRQSEIYNDNYIKFYKSEFTPANPEQGTGNIGGTIATEMSIQDLQNDVFRIVDFTTEESNIQYQKFYVKNVNPVTTLYKINLFVEQQVTPYNYEIQFEDKNIVSTVISNESEEPTGLVWLDADNYSTSAYINTDIEQQKLEPGELVQVWIKRSITKTDYENQTELKPQVLAVGFTLDDSSGVPLRLYYGTNPNPDITEADLSNLQYDYLKVRQSELTLNGNGEYLYIIYPKSLGRQTFYINGLINTQWVETELIRGNGENLYVYRSLYKQNGENINIVLK